MGIRQDRLADEIRDILAVCFMGGQMSDPRLSTITITAVKLSGDYQVAKVYFRTIDPDATDLALEGLMHASGFLRHKIAEQLEIRRIPELRFFYDESVEHGARIEELITKLKVED